MLKDIEYLFRKWKNSEASEKETAEKELREILNKKAIDRIKKEKEI